MAKKDKFVSIDAYFVLDPWVQSLAITDRWVYFVLCCNPDRSVIGIYECALTTMKLYTGIGEEAILESFNRFAKAGKAHYVADHVIVKNHLKNNPIRGKAAGIVVGAHRAFKALPWDLQERITNPSDTLYIPYLDPTSELGLGYTKDMDKLVVEYGSRSRVHTPNGGYVRTDKPRSGGGAAVQKPKPNHKPGTDEYWLDR